MTSEANDDPAGVLEGRQQAADAATGAVDDDVGEQPAAALAATPPRRGGRLLGGLALLVALAALGGAAYLYYELIERSETGALETRIDALEDGLGGIGQRLDALAEEQRSALDGLREEQRQARAASESALRESLAEVSRQAPPSTGEWQRAEVQYLLRIANHRVLMEHDVRGALGLLRAADAELADLDDFSMHEVRARLADEIANLERYQGTDLEGLFLRLEAAKRHLDALPLRVPEYLRPAEEQPAPDAQGVWPTFVHQIGSLVRFRHLDGAVKPLLAPEEAVYLELNLRLMLERAQMAAVRGEQMMYDESLTTAVDWLRRYLDLNEFPAKRLLTELEGLQSVELERPLPDVSGSLNALQAVLRNPS